MASKSCTYTETPKKSENLSKMVRDELYGTFCSRYQIVSSKDTFVLKIDHPFPRDTVHLS